MQINQQALTQLLQKKIHHLNVLIGQDHYLIDEALNNIKSMLKKSSECDEKILSIQSPEEWHVVLEETNNYSLFYQTVILTIFFDKKTIDTTGKKFLVNISNQPTLIVILLSEPLTLPPSNFNG